MIYQLFRLIHGTRVASLLGALFAMVVLAGALGYFGGMAGVAVWSDLSIMVTLFLRMAPRCTIFEATLPIRPREILAAQIAGAAALIWAPAVLAAAFLAGGSAKDHRELVILIEIASVVTLWAIGINSLRLRRMSNPGLWREAAMGAAVVAATILVVVMSKRHFIAPAVLGICAAGSTALLTRIWRGAPETFELTGREAASVEGERRSLLPAFTWLPAMRVLFSPWQSVVFVFVAALTALEGQMLYGLGFLSIALVDAVPPTRWVWSLPIPRPKVFLCAILSRLGPFFLAVLAGLLIAGEPASVIVVVLAATALASLLLVLWFSSIFRASKHFAYRMASIAPLLAVLVVAIIAKPPEEAQVAARVAAALSPNFAVWIAAAAAITGAVGWIAYSVFCRMEPRPDNPATKVRLY